MSMRHLREHPRSVAAAAVAIAVAALAATASAVGFGSVGAAFARLRPAWLALAVGGPVLAYGGYVLAYRAVARLGDGPPLEHGLAARIVLAGFGAQAPGGGFALDTRMLRGLSGRSTRPVVRVLGLGALEWTLLAPAAAVVAVILLLGHGTAQRALLWSWALAVPAGFAIGFGLAQPRRAERLAARRGWRGAIGRGLAGVGVVRRLAAHPLRGADAWLGMAVYWAADIAAFYGALRAFGVRLPATEAILAYATGYAATRRSLPLGGAGGTEVLMVLALHWVGLPLAAAIPPVALYRLVTFVLPTIPALPLSRRLRPLLRRGDRTAAAPQAGRVRV